MRWRGGCLGQRSAEFRLPFVKRFCHPARLPRHLIAATPSAIAAAASPAVIAAATSPAAIAAATAAAISNAEPARPLGTSRRTPHNALVWKLVGGKVLGDSFVLGFVPGGWS